MTKKLVLGASAAVVSFMIAGGVAFAQSPTASPAASATPMASTTVPSAAPATGFGPQ